MDLTSFLNSTFLVTNIWYYVLKIDVGQEWSHWPTLSRYVKIIVGHSNKVILMWCQRKCTPSVMGFNKICNRQPWSMSGQALVTGWYHPMNGENRPLVTSYRLNLTNNQVKKLTDHFRRIHRMYLKLIKKSWKITTCTWLGLETLEFDGSCPKISLDSGIIWLVETKSIPIWQ